jgi:hypothetical protein
MSTTPPRDADVCALSVTASVPVPVTVACPSSLVMPRESRSCRHQARNDEDDWKAKEKTGKGMMMMRPLLLLHAAATLSTMVKWLSGA